MYSEIKPVYDVLRECGRFFKRHWFHFVLMIPGAVLYTMLHEGMHALAVILQGGRVIEFVWVLSSHPPSKDPLFSRCGAVSIRRTSAAHSLSVPKGCRGP